MSQSPIVSRVLIVPGLLQNGRFQSISMGLVIDEDRVVWGELQPDFDDPLAFLREKIAPIFEERPLTAFQAMMDELEGVEETAVITRQTPKEQPASVSRRRFLTGNLTTAAKPALVTERVTVTRPARPTLRYGISQIILSALALARGQTVAETIAAEYELPLRHTPAPLHLDIEAGQTAPNTAVLSSPIQSLGYRISGQNPKEQLGANGERLQRFVRQLTNLLDSVTEPSYRPTLHLSVGGSLGQIFDNDAGRILGALYGLEQAAKPYQLRVADPVLLANPQKQRELMRQLMDYGRMRRMNIQLVASESINSLADAAAFIDAGAAHMLELTLPRLGAVSQTIKAVQACQQGNMAVLLRDEGGDTAVALALVAKPALLATNWTARGNQEINRVFSEMARTLATVDYRKEWKRK